MSFVFINVIARRPAAEITYCAFNTDRLRQMCNKGMLRDSNICMRVLFDGECGHNIQEWRRLCAIRWECSWKAPGTISNNHFCDQARETYRPWGSSCHSTAWSVAALHQFDKAMCLQMESGSSFIRWQTDCGLQPFQRLVIEKFMENSNKIYKQENCLLNVCLLGMSHARNSPHNHVHYVYFMAYRTGLQQLLAFRISAPNPHYEGLTGSCLVEIGLLGCSYSKVFTEGCVPTPEHTQFNLS